MQKQKIVIALGGNALGNTPKEQQERIDNAAPALIGLIKQGHEIIISHGNGPQVGMISKAFEIGARHDSGICPMELMECTAMSQGYIGIDLQNAIKYELYKRNMDVKVSTILSQVEVDPAVLHRMKAGQRAASPGMKYKHYSPKAEVVIVDAAPQEYVEYVNQRGDGWALCFEEDAPFLQVPALAYGSRYDSASQAHRLFEALHGLDEAGVASRAYARLPRKRGVGLAVYNRLIRAAAFQVINPKGRHILGLTGPTGAGKSTAAQVLRDRGWLVVDCDQATRSPLVYDGPCLAELSTAFGPQVLRDGMLDRAELARRAFSSEEARTRLGEITFPRILRYVRKLLEEGEAQGYRQLALDAPTLLEAGLDSICSRVLVVNAPKEERLARILRRDGLTPEAALRRLEAQPSPEFYTSRADFLVENGPGTDMKAALAPFLEELEQELENPSL